MQNDHIYIKCACVRIILIPTGSDTTFRPPSHQIWCCDEHSACPLHLHWDCGPVITAACHNTCHRIVQHLKLSLALLFWSPKSVLRRGYQSQQSNTDGTQQTTWLNFTQLWSCCVNYEQRPGAEPWQVFIAAPDLVWMQPYSPLRKC